MHRCRLEQIVIYIEVKTKETFERDKKTFCCLHTIYESRQTSFCSGITFAGLHSLVKASENLLIYCVLSRLT